MAKQKPKGSPRPAKGPAKAHGSTGGAGKAPASQPSLLPTSDYRHKTAKRKNNPPAKIAAEGTVPAVAKARYAYSPHLAPVLRFDPSADADRAAARVAALIDKAAKGPLTDEERATLREALDNREPWLEWATKREQHQRGYFEVDPVALHIHERVSAQAIMRVAARQDVTHSLFADPEQTYHEAVQFYRHDIDWTNRLILGDSLQVMSSLARREDLAGKVQMIYMDPPYGIKFASNFQPEVGKRDVKDKDTDLTREAEVVKAYGDTWRLGVHSYLSYLRDRLAAARELLADTGSIFVQIGDKNLHVVRSLMDEVFGASNFVLGIVLKKKGAATPTDPVNDHVIWFARDRERMRVRGLNERRVSPDDDPKFNTLILKDGRHVRRSGIGNEEWERLLVEHSPARVNWPLVSQDLDRERSRDFSWLGRSFKCGGQRHWTYDPVVDMHRLANAERVFSAGGSAAGIVYWADWPYIAMPNVWDFHGDQDPLFVVQTNRNAVGRCLLLTTDPGDLVLDPTCGSGTTAYVAEQWGRRWITIDTSRVAIAIARQRLLTGKYDYYRTKTPDDQPNGNPSVGFRYKAVPHITLKSIAQNTNLDPIFACHEPILAERINGANAALARAPGTLREAMARKYAAKAATDGLSSLTDADARRWLLPGMSRDTIAAALDAAFRKVGKKPPTIKQVQAIAERVPTRAEVGPSSIPEKGVGWEGWQAPFDTDPAWPRELQEAVTAYRAAWRAKMDEVNACIAANAEQEELVDQPEVVKGVTRVSGPFTVEAVQPPEMSLGEAGEPVEFAGAPEALEDEFEFDEKMTGKTFVPRIVDTQGDLEARNALAYLKQLFDLIRRDGVTLLGNKGMVWSRLDPIYESGTGTIFHAEGRWTVAGNGTDADPQGDATVAVVFGPQYGPVTAKVVEEAMRQAARTGYEHLVLAGFAFDGTATAAISEAGADQGMRTAGGKRLFVHLASIRPDVNPAMAGLLKDPQQQKAGDGGGGGRGGASSQQLFTVFGLPRVSVNGPGKAGAMGDLKAGEPPEGEYTVTMEGVDIYDPVKDVIEDTKAGKVAAWFLDSDYDGRTFCITQAFFPDRSAWEKLARALGDKGAVDPARFEAFSGTTSLPFPKGKHGKVAVKVIDPRGNEVVKVVGLE